MSSSRPASKVKALPDRIAELQMELENTFAALKPIPDVYVPAIVTKNDTTNSIPELAVLVVGNDDRVTSAFANSLRVYIEQYMEIPTVPLGNLVESGNFVDYEAVREEHRTEHPSDQNEFILDEVQSIWDGMCNSYPAFRRGQVRIGVEIVKGDVSLMKEVRHTAQISVGENKVVDQVLTTIYP